MGQRLVQGNVSYYIGFFEVCKFCAFDKFVKFKSSKKLTKIRILIIQHLAWQYWITCELFRLAIHENKIMKKLRMRHLQNLSTPKNQVYDILPATRAILEYCPGRCMAFSYLLIHPKSTIKCDKLQYKYRDSIVHQASSHSLTTCAKRCYILVVPRVITAVQGLRVYTIQCKILMWGNILICIANTDCLRDYLSIFYLSNF